MNLITKQHATPPRSIDEKSRTIDFVSSTETPDRFGDVIRARGWVLTNFEKNPVFLFAHRSTEPPIGKVIKSVIQQNPPALVQTVQFASNEAYPFAETIRRLYAENILRGVSVGFSPLEDPDPIIGDTGRITGYEYKSQELLELSAVPIPCQPEALARAVTKGIASESEMLNLFSRSEPSIKVSTLDELCSFVIQNEHQRVKGMGA